MTDEQTDVNLYDKIRREAEEKRAKKLEQQQKNDEFWKRLKSDDPHNLKGDK